MKTAVVFYTYDGSTGVAAQALAVKLGADIFELKEKRQRSKSPMTFVSGGFAAGLGLKSRLQDSFASRMGEYERILIGTPIWASHPVPAVNAFVKQFDPTGKQVMVFLVQADPNPAEKGLEKLNAVIRKKGGTLLPPMRLHGDAPGKTASKEHIGAQIEQKLRILE